MNDWRTALREADASSQAVLPPVAVDAMRRRVIAASVDEPGGASWLQPALVAVTVVLMVGVGVVAGRRLPSPAPSPAIAQHPAPETRQLQFATPGGTRIIWVFNSEFDVRESMP